MKWKKEEKNEVRKTNKNNSDNHFFFNSHLIITVNPQDFPFATNEFYNKMHNKINYTPIIWIGVKFKLIINVEKKNTKIVNNVQILVNSVQDSKWMVKKLVNDVGILVNDI